MRLCGKANAMANTSRKETKPFTSPLEEMKAPTQSLFFRRRDGCFTAACVFHMHLLQRYDMFCVLYEVIFRNSRTNSGECAFCFMHLSVLSLILLCNLLQPLKRNHPGQLMCHPQWKVSLARVW